MPGFATGLDEAIQVTTDPYVAYTLYLGMPYTDVIQTFDSLPDWKKTTEYVKNKQFPGYDYVNVTYTRVLKDKTKQTLAFKSYVNSSKLSEFALTFYCPNLTDAQKMFEQAYRNIDSAKKWYKAGSLKSGYTTFWDDDGYTIGISIKKIRKASL